MSELTIQEKINRLIKEHSKELKTQEQISAFSTMMMKNLLETALGAEMDDHLGYEIYLAIDRASKRWTMPIRDWAAALNRFALEFGDRLK